MNKLCKLCNDEKPLDKMCKNKTSKDGYLYKCIDCKKEEFKQYYYKNKEKLADKNKVYYIDNIDELKKQHKTYYKNNKIVSNNYRKKRRKEDSNYRLKGNIRTMISRSIKNAKLNKNSKSELILGCSFEEFKTYIESKFEIWMSWENYGLYNGELNYGWDIDHIIPLSSAITEEELLKLNHYSNLQPLCSYNNRHIKSNKLL